MRKMIARLPAPLKRPARRLTIRARQVVYNVPVMRAAAAYLRRYYRFETHRLWTAPTPPEWFDHRANVYTFSDDRDPLWTERGVLSREPMFDGCRVLDLCCGDGFYAAHFFSTVAGQVDAVDFDAGAIAHARRWHAAPNVSFAAVDVRTAPFPHDSYDVVVWDGAIEHFTEDEIASLLDRCANALAPTRGVLTGYTIIRDPSGPSHPDHEHEFESAAELAETLSRHFPHVATLENTSPGRRNLYFRAAFDEHRLTGWSVSRAGASIG